MQSTLQIPNQTKSLRVISITGGKGGIGKTTLSVNLAVAFAKMKKKVLLFDADLGLANVDVMLGLMPKKTIHDVISGQCQLKDICMQGPHGLKIIPSSSGIQKMSELSSMESMELIRSFSSLTDEIDIMIIDTASGISSQVIDMTHASQDILTVICNEPSSLMDSYAVIKILHQKYARSRFGIVVNKVLNAQEGFNIFSQFQEVVSRFINISLHYLGHVPQDDFFNISARERVTVIDKYPTTKAGLSLQNLCHGITHWNTESLSSGGIHFFFDRLVLNNR